MVAVLMLPVLLHLARSEVSEPAARHGTLVVTHALDTQLERLKLGPGHGVLGPRHRGVAPVQVQLREVVLVF